jgi:hypothetical protein
MRCVSYPFIAVLALTLALLGCSDLPSQSFEHSSRSAVKRICIAPLGAPEHAQVQIMNPIGAGFGVVGNFIESRRAAGATEQMQSILSAARYDFGNALSNSIAKAVSKVGFQITRTPGPRPEKDRFKFLRKYTTSAKHVDAYLDVYATYVGFEASQSSTAYRPRIEITARLVSARDNKTLFQDRIVYGSAENADEEAVLVKADDNLAFRNRDAFQADPIRTARALQSAIDAVSWELAKQFM